MQKEFQLFVDESGDANYSHPSGLYIACGCSVPLDRKQDLKVRADQIKFKYWGRTDVVLHSKEIYNCENDFRLFKQDKALRDEFHKDLLGFLRWAPCDLFVVVLDKREAQARRWGKQRIYRTCCRTLLNHYVQFLLLKDAKGKVHIEASVEKDNYYLDAYRYVISPQSAFLPKREGETARKLLTSISFVSKNNHDIEEQMADLFAYGAKLKFLTDRKIKAVGPNSYEGRLMSVFGHKLFDIPASAGPEKAKYYRRITPYAVFPK